MNIRTTSPRLAVAAAPAQGQQPPAQQPPAEQQPAPPVDAFATNFSSALETSVPIYTAAAGVGWGAVGGTIAGTVVGGIVGSAGGAAIGGLVGLVGGGLLGAKSGHSFGKWAMKKSGDLGAAHNPENPQQGKAIGQAVAGGAITFLSGSPVMTALVVGGSALYATHKTAAEG